MKEGKKIGKRGEGVKRIRENGKRRKKWKNKKIK